jgi:hypothetical protein
LAGGHEYYQGIAAYISYLVEMTRLPPGELQAKAKDLRNVLVYITRYNLPVMEALLVSQGRYIFEATGPRRSKESRKPGASVGWEEEPKKCTARKKLVERESSETEDSNRYSSLDGDSDQSSGKGPGKDWQEQSDSEKD